MNRTTKIIIICLIGIIIVGGSAYLLARNGTSPKTDTSETPSQATGDSGSPAETDTPPADATATITYTNNGFNPKTLTITAGATVVIKNQSSEDLLFSSNDHPTHTHNDELNEAALGPDQSQTITPTTKGTWGFHNHLDANKTGTLVVQ